MGFKLIRSVIEGRKLCHAAPEASLREACRRLETCDEGALAVIEKGGLVGILTERDVIRRAVCRGLAMDGTSVGRVMTPDPATADIDESLSDAQTIMMAGRFRHLPVLDAGRPVGMLSFRDVPAEYRVMVERYGLYRDGAAL
ncbi:CBS domain-containing protein [Rhodovulum sp. ES.010]|uniref:CBS domain-containing protein n=1 Tax=Rhodovulum sp. ES.010 TaxID=1882821 RepID=UPI00092CBE61|nr:CBS domain-containing protein [Rhodovulum sp. ES.010]SIO39871.1 CBS domain-containing protein [Rhodovulum sp. ES.010]